MSDADVDPETLRRSLLLERLVAAGSLAEGLAHEVRNPFNVVRLQLAVLQRRLALPDCPPASLQPVTELMDAALRRLEVLFDDLLFLVQPRPMPGTVLGGGDRWPGIMTLVRTEEGRLILKVSDPDPAI
jgi:signal transduction histidine kinase